MLFAVLPGSEDLTSASGETWFCPLQPVSVLAVWPRSVCRKNPTLSEEPDDRKHYPVTLHRGTNYTRQKIRCHFSFSPKLFDLFNQIHTTLNGPRSVQRSPHELHVVSMYPCIWRYVCRQAFVILRGQMVWWTSGLVKKYRWNTRFLTFSLDRIYYIAKCNCRQTFLNMSTLVFLNSKID